MSYMPPQACLREEVKQRHRELAHGWRWGTSEERVYPRRHITKSGDSPTGRMSMKRPKGAECEWARRVKRGKRNDNLHGGYRWIRIKLKYTR